MMHIFLTGEIQIGKSTVIQKTLSLLNVSYGGFRTYFGPDRANPDRYLYISEAAAPPRYDQQHVVAHFSKGSMPETYVEQFDVLGVKYISETSANAKLIIMDECGNLEQDAQVFQQEIFRALEGETPILGVIKLSANGWVDKIRQHPKVKLITVDETNRDILPAFLGPRGRQTVSKPLEISRNMW